MNKGSAPITTAKPGPGVHGLLAEFTSSDQLLAAAARVKEQGFTRWDCFSPFPVHGLDQAMGIKPTILPMLVGVFGATGAATGLLMQWWMNAYDYPFIVSNKPNASPWEMLPAMTPIIFELMVLFACFGGVLTMFVLNDLPRFNHPLFGSKRFARVTNDRFFICIEATDPKFRADQTAAFLASLGAVGVERVGATSTEPSSLEAVLAGRALEAIH